MHLERQARCECIKNPLFCNYEIGCSSFKDKDGLSGGHIISVCTLRDSLDIVFDNETDMLLWLELLLSCQQVRVMKLTYYPETMNQDFFSQTFSKLKAI